MWTFASEHYITAFLAFVAAAVVLDSIVCNCLRVLVRTYRMVMVMVRGWPPDHLDADGDWKPTEKQEGPK